MIWEWLAKHRTLYKLRRVLVRLGRTDLAYVLDYDLTKIDRPTIAHISDQASRLVQSIMPAKAARTPTDLLASTAIARHRASILRTQMSSLPMLQNHPLLALRWRMNWSAEFARAESALGSLTRVPPATKGQARQAINGVENMVKYARDVESAAVALNELASSPALSL